MNIDGAILQFGGSLIAILLLAGLAYWLGLGGKPKIISAEHATRLAGEVVFGFDASECSIDSEGASALLSDRTGRIMVLKRHGSQFAGRILNSNSNADAKGDQLEVESGERRYGSVSMLIPNAQDWAKRVKALRNTNNA